MRSHEEGHCARCDKELDPDSEFKCCKSCRDSMRVWRRFQRQGYKYGGELALNTIPMADSSVSVEEYEPKIEEEYNGSCSHLPGSQGKVDILAERYARGESLWQSEDADGCVSHEDRNDGRRIRRDEH